MRISIHQVGPFYVNCYVVSDEGTGETVVIDPGGVSEELLEQLDKIGAERIKYILLTHMHFDHILGLEDVARTWGIDVWVHPLDREQMVHSGQWCAQLGLTFKPFTGQMHDLSDGQTLSFGESSFEVLATPGHTQGGVCFYSSEAAVLFSGDTLFAGSIGRTDHPGGDYDQLIHSILNKILPLDGDVTVLPGHGPATSVGYERATNPFLQPA